MKKGLVLIIKIDETKLSEELQKQDVMCFMTKTGKYHGFKQNYELHLYILLLLKVPHSLEEYNIQSNHATNR